MRSSPPNSGSSLAELRPLPSLGAMVSGSVEAGSQRLKPLEGVTRLDAEVTESVGDDWLWLCPIYGTRCPFDMTCSLLLRGLPSSADSPSQLHAGARCARTRDAPVCRQSTDELGSTLPSPDFMHEGSHKDGLGECILYCQRGFTLAIGTPYQHRIHQRRMFIRRLPTQTVGVRI